MTAPATPDGGTIRRIILALDAGADTGGALVAATGLAARLSAELEAVFLEDVNLIHSAEFPFVRRVSPLSAAAEAFDLAGVERELRLIAGAKRRALAAEAARLRVSWSFRIVRGRAEEEMASAARGCDLVIFGGDRRTETGFKRRGWIRQAVAVKCPGPVMLVPGRAPGLEGPVIAVYDGGPHGRQVLVLAAQLAAAENRELMVLATAPGVEEAKPLADQVRAWLDAETRTADVRVAVAASMTRLCNVLRESRGVGVGGTTLVDAAGPLLQKGDALDALEELDGAVLLVQR